MTFVIEALIAIVVIVVLGIPLSRALAKRIEGGPDLKVLCGIVDGLVSRIDAGEEDVQRLESEVQRISEEVEFNRTALGNGASSQRLPSG
jgi:hypothetical protein